MIYLFIDIDGVLHPEFEGQAVPPDEALCHLNRFETVMREFPSVMIVISSQWRLDFPIDDLRSKFSDDIAARIVGSTPNLSGHGRAQREDEILAWMIDNAAHSDRWLTLDDAIWLFTRHRDKVLAPTSWKGLDDQVSNELRERIRAVLQDERES